MPAAPVGSHPASLQTVSSIPMLFDKHFWLIICLIAALMFGLRLSQIGHGLPDVMLGDESSDMSSTAWLLAGKTPPTFWYHRLIVSNIEIIGFAAVYVVNAVRTGNPSIAEFQNHYFANHAEFIFASRLLIVVLSVIALIALADLMRRATSKIGAVIAALLMCFSYFLNLHSIYAMPDTLIPSAIVLFVWATVLVLQQGTPLAYGLAGAALAFVFMSKFSALPIALALCAAHVFRVWNIGPRSQQLLKYLVGDRVLFSVLGFVIGCIILNPLAVTHLGQVKAETEFMLSYATGSPLASENSLTNVVAAILNIATSRFPARAADFVQNYLGIPLALCCLIGITSILVRRRPGGAVILIAWLCTWLSIAVSAERFKPPYWLASVPLTLILAAIGLLELLDFTRVRSRVAHGLAIAAVMLIILNEAFITIKTVQVVRNGYTFEQAQNYIYQVWPNSSAILMASENTSTVPLHRNALSIERARSLGAPDLQTWAWWLRQSAEYRQNQHEYNIFGPEFRSGVETYEDTYRLLVRQHIRYVIDVDMCIGSDNRPGATSSQEFPALNNDLRSRLKLVAVFSPFQDSLYCPFPVEDRLTFHARNDVFTLRGLGPVIRLYETDLSNGPLEPF